MISSLSWIPRGSSKAVLEVAEPPSQEEIDEMLKAAALERSGESDEEEEDDANMDDAAAKKANEIANALAIAEALGRGTKKKKEGVAFEDITDGLRELDMDNYDEEDADIELFSSGKGDLYYTSNDMDPYLKDKDEDEDSEELEDIAVKPTDSLIVCARTDDEVNLLEVYLLEEKDDGESNMYVHHEVVISEFPLCTAWLDCPLKGGERGNFIAIGSMGPAIEIWDLDIMDAVEPCLVLGGEEKTKKKKKKKKASVKYVEGSHTDSVLGLAWNKEFRNILASAGADRQVKIWDVSVGKCNITMEHHTDKVQSVAWNHHAPQVLLSGSFDHSIVMKDGRMPTHSGYNWLVTADVESLAWDPHSEHSFVVSLEDGTIRGFDIRAAASNQNAESKPRFTLHAHDKAVSTIAFNPSAPNLLATGSTDKTVKLWDLSNNQPSRVMSRQPKLGAVFSISFSEDSPFLLAMGGSKGKLEVWDTLSEAGVFQRFGNFSQTNRSKPAS